MGNNNELKEIDFKKCACYYFDIILLDEKSYKTYENILIYDFSYKTFMGAKPLRIWFKEIDGFIKTYDVIRYLVIFASERYNVIYDRINYLITKKIGITYNVNHNFERIRIGLYHFFPVEKTLAFHNVITLIKSVVNEHKNDYY